MRYSIRAFCTTSINPLSSSTTRTVAFSARQSTVPHGQAYYYFMTEDMQLFPWPVHFQDINVMESFWEIHVRALYHDGRQFDTVSDLKKDSSWSGKLWTY